MHPFAVGDLVVCVDDTPLPLRPRPQGGFWPVEGRLYRVSKLLKDVHGNFGVRLAGVVDHPDVPGWHAWRFRRVEPADAAFTEQMRRIGRQAGPARPADAPGDSPAERLKEIERLLGQKELGRLHPELGDVYDQLDPAMRDLTDSIVSSSLRQRKMRLAAGRER